MLILNNKIIEVIGFFNIYMKGEKEIFEFQYQ